MTIGELAQAAGVRISTLRFYERRGLLRPASRSAAGYRHFGDDDVARVRFLRRAQELGFGLTELAAMLALSGQRTVRRRDIASAGSAKLAELDQRITDLRRVRRALAGLLAEPCLDLEAPCPIIASLATSPHRAAASTPRADSPQRRPSQRRAAPRHPPRLDGASKAARR